MKRRSFLKLLGCTPAVAALPRKKQVKPGVKHPQFKWLEKPASTPFHTTVIDSMSEGVCCIPVSDYRAVSPKALLYCPATGERILVHSVTRAWPCGTATFVASRPITRAIPIGSALIRLGELHAESTSKVVDYGETGTWLDPTPGPFQKLCEHFGEKQC